MNKQEILFTHFNDTYSLQQEREKRRNRLFIMVFILIIISSFLSIDPTSMTAILKSFIYKKTNIDISNNLNLLNSIIWILLFYLVLSYYQLCIQISNTYSYLHALEEDINKLTNITFNREGADYIKKYGIFSKHIFNIYTLVFPILFLIVIFVKIYLELFNFLHLKNYSHTLLIFLILNIVIAIYIAVIIFKFITIMRHNNND